MAAAPVKRQSSLKASDIKLHHLRFGLQNVLTVLKDDEDSLHLSAPYFRVTTTFEIPKLPDGANIQIGWVQVCTEMDLVSVYGDVGISSIEFPELVSGKFKMLSDADCSQFPWYGSTNQLTSLQGPTKGISVRTVFMEDKISSEISWEEPGFYYTPEPTLSFVYRKQRFYDYLVLKDVNTNTYQILKTITWFLELAIDVNVKNPVGKRSKLLGPFQYECPKVVPEHLTPPLECHALNPPTCNASQIVVWRPFNGKPEVIRQPVLTTMDLDEYIASTEEHGERLKQINKDNFLAGKL